MIGGDKGKIAFIVETGWRGIRQASSAYLGKGLAIDIVIKGMVSKAILDIITRPVDKYRIKAAPRIFFRVFLFFYLLLHKIVWGLETVIVTKERTQRWVKGFGFETKMLIETENGYELK